MTNYYHSEYEALKDASRLRRMRCFQAKYLGLVDGWHVVRVW